MLTLLDITQRKNEINRNIDLIYDRMQSIPENDRGKYMLEILGSLHNLVTHSESCADDAQDMVDAHGIDVNMNRVYRV